MTRHAPGPARRTAPAGRAAVDFGPATVFLGANDGKYPDCNQMVVAGTDIRMAIDSSISSHLIGPEFDSADLAVLSHGHEDHMAGLCRLPGVPVQAPVPDLAAVRSWPGMARACGFDPSIHAPMLELFERDFAYAPRPDATGYGDGHVWDLGGVRVRAIHTPGHTAGHSALMVEDQGLLFIADIDLTGFGPYYGDATSSLSDFSASIRLVREIPARVWVTGHHRGIYDDRARFLADLDRYAARIEARDIRILDRIAARPATLEELVDHRILYPAGFDAIWLRPVETRAILRHLEGLMRRHRVLLDPATGRYSRA